MSAFELEQTAAFVTPGQTLRLFYGEGNPSNKRLHIRAIVDDEYVVYRYWLRRKQYWAYEIRSLYWFQINATYLFKI